MIKKSRNILLIFFLFLLIFIYYFLFKNQNKKADINISLFPKNFLPSYVEGERNIVFDIKKDDLNFPQKLFYLKKEILPALSRSEAELIAKNLDFSNLPIESKGVSRGETLIWNNEKHSLSINLKNRTITYELNIYQTDYVDNTKDGRFSEEDIKNYVTNFLLNNFNPFFSNLSLSNIYYLKRIEGSNAYKNTDKESSEILQLNYIDGNAEYPILTSNPLQTNIYVQILKDKTISFIELKLMGKFVKSEEEFYLKNFEEIVKESKNSKIVDMEEIYLKDIKSSDIDNININDISIAYYIEDNSQEILNPVYVLKGFIKLKESNSKSPITLYLPAYK